MVGSMNSELVGLHMKGVLASELFIILGIS